MLGIRVALQSEIVKKDRPVRR